MLRGPAARAALAALVLALAPVSRGHAQVPLAGNFPATGLTKAAYSTSITQSLAVGISVGAQGWSFGALRAPINNFGQASTVSGGIYSSVGGAPGTLLAALGGIVIPLDEPIPTVYNFTTSTTFTLQASTSYFFVLTGTGPNSGWVDANAAAVGLQSGISVLGEQFKSFSNDWRPFDTDTYLRYEITGSPVTANVVPEPSTYVLMATGLTGLVAVARRRRTV
jgi:hypothetical protein